MTRIFICDIYSISEEKITSFLDDFPFGKSEKDRLEKIKNQDRKGSSLAALISLARLVDEYLPLSIERTENGKPFFKDLTSLKFNLSHAGGIAVVAVSDCDIGVDIEFIRDDVDTQRIAERFFAPTDIKNEDFFSLWTKKEAYSKMLGSTLAPNLSKELPNDIFKQLEVSFKDSRGYISICSERLRDPRESVEIFAEEGIHLK